MASPGLPAPPKLLRKIYRGLSRTLAPVKRYLRPANVVCFHPGRVGSTVLGDQLKQHPRVCWRGEVFWKEAMRWRDLEEGRGFFPVEDLRRILRRESDRAGLRIFGAEIKYTDLEMYGLSIRELLPWLKRNAFTHFILQRRRNVLRQHVSGLIVDRSMRWRQLQGETPRLTRIRVDPGAADRHGRSLREVIERLIRFHEDAAVQLEGERLLELTYEDDIEPDPGIAYQRVCDFLGAERAPVRINDARMNPYPLREMLENYEEVARYLEDTPYAWMLEG